MVNNIIISYEETNDTYQTGKWTVIDGTLETWTESVTDDEFMEWLSEIESTKPVEVIALMPTSMINVGGITRLPLTQANL